MIRVGSAFVEPPAPVVVGPEREATIPLPTTATLPAALVLFEHYGDQYRLRVKESFTGAISFDGFAGPYVDLAEWAAKDGQRPPIGLRNRACGELFVGDLRFRFLCSPPRTAIDPVGPPPSLFTSEIAAGLWVCTTCHRINPQRLRFCMGCGGDVEQVRALGAGYDRESPFA